MWAHFWCSKPAERPMPLTPHRHRRRLLSTALLAMLYDIAGNVLDSAKTVLIIGGPTVPDVISSEPSTRRAMAELTALGSKPAPAASRNDSWTLSSRAVHWIIVAGAVVGVVLVLCVVAVFVRQRRRRRRRRRRPVEPRQQPPAIHRKDGPTRPVLPQAPSKHYFAQQHRPTRLPRPAARFSDAGSIDIVTELPAGGSHSYEQLSAATKGFSSNNVIGQGGFGCVYRGRLLGGTEVAIKKLKTESRQCDREFRAEFEIISRVHHRNLITLGTMDHLLTGIKDGKLFWDLQGGWPIYTTTVADFGLAKYQPGDHTHVSTRVMGTFGYIAPGFLSSGKLTDSRCLCFRCCPLGTGNWKATGSVISVLQG